MACSSVQGSWGGGGGQINEEVGALDQMTQIKLTSNLKRCWWDANDNDAEESQANIIMIVIVAPIVIAGDANNKDDEGGVDP